MIFFSLFKVFKWLAKYRFIEVISLESGQEPLTPLHSLLCKSMNASRFLVHCNMRFPYSKAPLYLRTLNHVGGLGMWFQILYFQPHFFERMPALSVILVYHQICHQLWLSLNPQEKGRSMITSVEQTCAVWPNEDSLTGFLAGFLDAITASLTHYS